MQDDLLVELELSSSLSTSYAPRKLGGASKIWRICSVISVGDDGGDERATTRLFHRATETSYGSCDGGLSEVSLSD
ncbi:hypothetical protein Tco_0387113 [Tanacetum coccineum]